MIYRNRFLVLAALLTVAAPALRSAEPSPEVMADSARPLLRAGEALKFTVRSARLGSMGMAEMSVRMDTIGGHDAYLLSFDFAARVAIFKVSDHTRSWLSADSLSMLRYTKRERSPLGGRDEDVRVDAEAGQWVDGKARAPLASSRPLDELSFIYLVRSLDLDVSETIEVRRHFDARRNPVRITATGREQVGGKDAVVYEMSVPDPRSKGGRSTLRFYISDDAARLPLRIESNMPVAGQITMTLASAEVLPALAAR